MKKKRTTSRYKKTSKQIDPIKRYECDVGEISRDTQTTISISLKKDIGEFADVYCVAKNEKKLAALDFSTLGKNKFRKLNRSLINKVIQYCNYKNVKALHNKKRGGMYLKTVFFTQKNYANALKLMDILWNPVHLFQPIDEQIAIGLLLGYKHKNIIAFVEKNYKIKLDPNKWKIVFKNIQAEINKMSVSLEDLNKHSKIVLLETIPTI